MSNAMFTEKVQNFITALEWETCPANARAADEVMVWLALRMGPTKRRGAASALNAACRLAHVSLPAWAL